MALAAKLVLVLAILYLGLSVFLVVSPASIEFREPQLETLEEDIAELGELEELVNEDLTVGRLEAEAGPDPLAESRALLVLSGRVVDESRAGVPAAEVRLFLRRSFSWLREGRFDRGNRTRLREALRRSRAGETAKTKGDGSFSISGPAFARSTVQIGVRHPSHAPKLVERELQQSAGELRLDDIVLEPGGTAFGFVFTKGGGPLEGAELRWEAAGDRGQGNRGRSGQGRGMRGGRERGERGRRGERRSRVRGNSRSSRPSLGRLVPPARSDASGFFELTQLPPGRFSLRAEKASYLPGSSARFEMKTDARIDCGRILLEPGAELSGVVLDQQGEPIEEAEVVARLSRGALMGRFRGNSQSSRSRGPGRRGRGRNETPGSASPPAVDRTELLKLFRLMGHESKAKTDAKGRFHLDTLPEQGLRLSVRHPRFIDEEREPIEPTRTPELEIRMYRRLAVAGVVVDARNGRPIELYGIAGRRIGEGSRRGGRLGERRSSRASQAREAAGEFYGGRRGRGETRGSRGNRGNRPGRAGRSPRGGQLRERERQRRKQEAETREAQRQAQRLSAEAYLRQRLGLSGIAPRRIPEPEAHAGGHFVLEGLQPGDYVLDLGAPGYARIAAGPFKLERDQTVPCLTLRLEPGTALSGRVVDRKTGKAIAGARIVLSIPPLRPPAVSQQGRDALRERLRSVRGRARRGRSQRGPRDRGIRIDQTRSDSDGLYAFHAQRPGSYRITADAKEYISYVKDDLLLARRALEFRIGMSVGARVFGTVSGRKKGQEYSVVLVNSDGTRESAEVDPKDGSYEARRLPPGTYDVKVEKRETRSDFRRWAMAALLSNKPDGGSRLILVEGTEQRFDIDVGATAAGKVSGRVFRNGQAATGLEVRLMTTEPETGGNPGARFLGRLLGVLYRDRTDESGGFEIDTVPPGAYRLEIAVGGQPGRRRGRRGGRGGRGSSTVFREEILVTAGETVDRQFSLNTGQIKFRVLDEKAGEPIGRATISLVLASEASGIETKEWRRLASHRRIGVRSGKAETGEMPIGAYLCVVSGRGIVGRPQQLRIDQGERSVDVRVESAPQEKTPAEPGQENRGRRGAPQTGREGRGGRRGRGQGGGRRRRH